ncbi:hypothetical protein IAU59_005159 [Kwoniella sp. CBS 9459]
MEVGAPLTRSTASTMSTSAQEPPSSSSASSSSLSKDIVSPPCSPPTKKSFLARLRRNTSTPYPHSSHAASTPAFSMMSRTIPSQDGERRMGVMGVKKNQVGVPIMRGMNRSEVFAPSTSIKHGFALEDEIEWQRVKTLPRVRLVPPEDEGEPIMLYPPPHFVRPATPPPTLPHPFLSPPSSPPTSPPMRPGSPPQSPPRRPTSIYSSSPTWAGMADGFVLPPPKFTRTSAGWGGAPRSMGVILPKKREEVDEDRRKRMSGVSMNGAAWDQVGSPPRSPPGPGGSGRMRSLESQEEIAANKKMRIERDPPPTLQSIDDENPSTSSRITRPQSVTQSSDPLQEQVDADISVNQGPTEANTRATAADNTEPYRSDSMSESTPPDVSRPEPMIIDQAPPAEPSDSTGGESSDQQPNIKSPVSKAVRKSRALSLSAAFSSSSSLKNMEVPPLPSMPPRPPIRKQKSLKKFFFSSSTPPEATHLPPLPSASAVSVSGSEDNRQRMSLDEKINPSDVKEEKPKGMKILQRARSKPSLKIDVKVSSASTSTNDRATTPVTPALSTGRTEASGTASVIGTPASVTAIPAAPPAGTQPQPRGLSKRFSLSNMSQAFKRKSSMSNLHASAGASSSNSYSAVTPRDSSSESPVPTVPALPEQYRKVKETTKSRKIKESAVPISPRKSKTLPVEPSLGQVNQAIDMSLDERLIPTGLPRRSESMKGIQRLSSPEVGADDPMASAGGQDRVLESGVMTKSPDLIASPIEDQTMIMAPTRNRDLDLDQTLLPALDLVPASTAIAPIERPTSTVSISMSSASSIIDDDDQAVEEEQEELVHAQLMHVSPRTRRDPSVSLQEFLASAPSRTGSVVIVPKGVRRSVEAIVIGSAVTGFTSTPSSIASGTNSPAFTPRARESVVLGMTLDRVMERRGSETEDEDELATPMDEVIDLFPADEDQSEEEILQEQGNGSADEDEARQEADQEDEGFQLVSEPTPRASAPSRSSYMQSAQDNTDADADADLDSLPSDTVLVETPPTPPPSQASPCGSTLTPVIAAPRESSTSTTKNRFASPEGLLKRLSTSKRPSHHHDQAHASTPYHHSRSNTDKKDKKGKERSQYHNIPIPPVPAPASAAAQGDPDGKEYSALYNEVQLRSLHFDSLGLDFGGWDGVAAEQMDVRA